MTDQAILQEIEQDNYRYAEPIEAVWEETENKCPDCGSMMMKYPAQTSPDDFDWCYICKGCGTTII